MVGGKWMAYEARSDGPELISIKRHKKRGIYRHGCILNGGPISTGCLLISGPNLKNNRDNSIFEIILFNQR